VCVAGKLLLSIMWGYYKTLKCQKKNESIMKKLHSKLNESNATVPKTADAVDDVDDVDGVMTLFTNPKYKV